MTLAEPAQSAAAGWFDRPMRWAQLTLAETIRNRTTSASRSTTSSALRRRLPERGRCGRLLPRPRSRCTISSAWLGDQDLFGDLVAACRRLDMVVVARTNSHALHQAAYEAHPDWVAVDASGQPRSTIGRRPRCGSRARSAVLQF